MGKFQAIEKGAGQLAAGARARRAEGAAVRQAKKKVPNASKKEASSRRDMAKQNARAANLRVNPKSKSAKVGRFAASKKGAAVGGVGVAGAGGGVAVNRKSKKK